MVSGETPAHHKLLLGIDEIHVKGIPAASPGTVSNNREDHLGYLRRLWLLAVVLLAYGCGGDTIVNTTPVVPPGPAPVPAGNILVRFELQPRLIPNIVTGFRFTGFAADGTAVYGSRTFPKVSEVLLDKVPVTTTRLSIEILVGDQVVGVANVAVTVTEGGTFVIDNVDFSSVEPDAALAIDPSTIVLSLGQQRTVIVVSNPNEANPVDVTTQATLTSSNPAVLRVDGPGQVTALSAGTATLTASFNGQTATSNVTVTNAVITSVTLSPTTSRVMGEFQFELVGTFSDGNTTNLTGVADWLSSAPGVLVVADNGLNSGLATTVSLGTAMVTATFQDLSATQTVTTTGGARLVSANGTNSDGGNDDSGLDNFLTQRQLSTNGRFLVYTSAADDLLPAGSPIVDGNGTEDVYLRDLTTNTNILVSVNAAGTAAGDSFSDEPAITPDGRYVFFHSSATDLTPVAPANPDQIYRRDLVLNTTEIVSLNGDAVPVPGDGNVEGPSVSADGNVVIFSSTASNFPTSGSGSERRIVWRNLTTGEVQVINIDPNGDPADDVGLYTLSGDGRFVAFNAELPPTPGNPVGSLVIYLRDTQLANTFLISTETNGNPLALAELPLIDNGATRVLFFVFGSGQLQTGTYSKNLATGELTFLTPVFATAVSDDGRFAAGVEGNFFFAGVGIPVLVDLQTGAQAPLNVTTEGLVQDDFFGLIGFVTSLPSISGDGRVTEFSSFIPLDPMVTNDNQQVYQVQNPFLP